MFQKSHLYDIFINERKLYLLKFSNSNATI